MQTWRRKAEILQSINLSQEWCDLTGPGLSRVPVGVYQNLHQNLKNHTLPEKGEAVQGSLLFMKWEAWAEGPSTKFLIFKPRTIIMPAIVGTLMRTERIDPCQGFIMSSVWGLVIAIPFCPLFVPWYSRLCSPHLAVSSPDTLASPFCCFEPYLNRHEEGLLYNTGKARSARVCEERLLVLFLQKRTTSRKKKGNSAIIQWS